MLKDDYSPKEPLCNLMSLWDASEIPPSSAGLIFTSLSELIAESYCTQKQPSMSILALIHHSRGTLSSVRPRCDGYLLIVEK